MISIIKTLFVHDIEVIVSFFYTFAFGMIDAACIHHPTFLFGKIFINYWSFFHCKEKLDIMHCDLLL